MRLFAAASVFLALAAFSPVQADSITFVLDQHFGAVAADGILKIMFDDGGSAGTVDVTFDASMLASDEFVSEWYFNFDGVANVDIDFNTAFADIGELNSFTRSSGQTLQADGDGKYSVKFGFNTSGNLFLGGETHTTTITGTGIVASDFNLLSDVGGGQGIFFSAAHVQSTGSDNMGSDWLGAGGGGDPIPEPTTLLLFGLVAGAFARRKLRR